MAKRRVTADQLRTVVRARLTKGDAFRLNPKDYNTTQAKVKAELAVLSPAEIFDQYPHCTYDLELRHG